MHDRGMSKSSRGGKKETVHNNSNNNNNMVNDELFVFLAVTMVGGGRQKNRKKERKKENARAPLPGPGNASRFARGFSRRKTRHYLRARQATTATTSGEDLQETARR